MRKKKRKKREMLSDWLKWHSTCRSLTSPWLTGDVIVLPLEELQAPEVWAELLKLERELDILVRLVTVQQGGVSLGHATALHLTFGHQVDFVELLCPPWGGVSPGAHDVHLVPYLRVEHQTLTGSESGKVRSKEIYINSKWTLKRQALI